MLVASECPQFSRVVEFTWFGPAQEQLQIIGFFAIVICGAVYELLPRVMGFELPFPKFVRAQHWCFMLGIILVAVPMAIGGIEQGLKMGNAGTAFLDVMQATLPFLRASTLGLLLLLLGSLLFAANIFVMTFKWNLAVTKTVIAYIKSPLEISEVKP
jgi:cytochrome c oxidase cbb3-type subunit 1